MESDASMNTRAAEERPAVIRRRRSSTSHPHGLVSSSKPSNHSNPIQIDPMDEDIEEPTLSASPPSPSIDPAHSVSILLAPSNLPPSINPSPPSKSHDAELERRLNSASAADPHRTKSAAGRTLVLAVGAGGALPPFCGPLVDILKEATSIESPERLFSSVEGRTGESISAANAQGNLILASGYGAWDLLKQLGDGPASGTGPRLGGLILIDPWVEVRELDGINSSRLTQSTTFILQFHTSRAPSDTDISLRDALGSQLFSAGDPEAKETADYVASTILEYLDGKRAGGLGAFTERERMDVLGEMVE